MLVLSRKVGERILVGDEITVTVVQISPNTVRIGIDAPREVNIVREELCCPPSPNGSDGRSDGDAQRQKPAADAVSFDVTLPHSSTGGA